MTPPFHPLRGQRHAAMLQAPAAILVYLLCALQLSAYYLMVGEDETATNWLNASKAAESALVAPIVLAPDTDTYTFCIQSDLAWTVSSDVNWLIPEQPVKETVGVSHVMSVEVEHNFTDNIRQGVLSITSVNPYLRTLTLVITQLPDDASAGLYYDIWDGRATLKFFIADDELTDITVPTQTPGGIPVNRIGNDAFNGQWELETVTLPAGIASIGSRAFQDCTSLREISLPASVTVLGPDAFSGCTALTSLNLKSCGITDIHAGCFRNCLKLKSITLPTVLKSLGDSAFEGCAALTALSIPAKVTSIGTKAFRDTGITAFTVDGFNGSFTAGNGVLYTRSGDRLIAYPPAAPATHFTMPTPVKAIGPYAFASCARLASIDFMYAYDLAVFGKGCFEGCSTLTHVQLSETAALIESEAFRDCTALKSMLFPDTAAQEIQDGAFRGCTSLDTFYFFGGKPKVKNGLGPATDKAIYALKSRGWTDGETFEGTRVHAASATYAMNNGNGVPNAAFGAGWPVHALAYPVDEDNLYFTNWSCTPASLLTDEQKKSNPVSFVMPSSNVTLKPYYDIVKYPVTLTHSVLKNGKSYDELVVGTVFSAKTAMPAGISFAKWVTEGITLPESERIKLYFDAVMPLNAVTVHAATVPLNFAYAVNSNLAFLAYGDVFFGMTAEDSYTEPNAGKACGGKAYLDTTVTGAGTLSFHWRMPSGGTLRLLMDNAVVNSFTPSELWQAVSVSIPAGTHEIQWAFIPDHPATDAVYLDDITFCSRKQKRKLTVTDGTGSGSYYPGALVTVEATQKQGLGFASWQSTQIPLNDADRTASPLTFIMPDKDATLKATFAKPVLLFGPADSAVRASSGHSGATCEKQTLSYAVTANSSWTAFSQEDWITVSSISEASFSIALAANSALASRRGTVTLQGASGISATLKVTQKGAAEYGPVTDIWNNQATLKTYVSDGIQTLISIPADIGGTPLTAILPGAFADCETVMQFETALDQGHFITRDGVLYTQDGTVLIAYPPAADATAFTVPEGVIAILPNAFANAETLTALTLPASLVDLDLDTLRDCPALETIAVTETSGTFLAVDGVLYDADGTTLLFYPPARVDHSFTVPEGVTDIAATVFCNAENLAMLTFPSTLSAIGASPFSGIEDSLVFIIFNGAPPQCASDLTVYLENAILTIPSNIGWERLCRQGADGPVIASTGAKVNFRDPSRVLDVVQFPIFLNYAEEPLQCAVRCNAPSWRLWRESRGAQDPVWFPVDKTWPGAADELCTVSVAVPPNTSRARRSQTLWFTADGCLPVIMPLTQVSRYDTLTVDYSRIRRGWNMLPVIVEPFMDSATAFLESARRLECHVFVCTPDALSPVPATVENLRSGCVLWLHHVGQGPLPVLYLNGVTETAPGLPKSAGWHVFSAADPAGIPPRTWTQRADAVYCFQDGRFVPVSPAESLKYINAYIVHIAD